MQSCETELHIDGEGDGLYKRVQQSPTKLQAMIKFYAGTPDLVAFSLVVPEEAFAHMRRALELVLRSQALSYGFAIDFLGFRVPRAATETPTWQEFISGKPHFRDGLSLTVRREDSDAS